MPILELFIITIVLVLIALLGLSVKLIFTKKGEFKGGSCQNIPENLRDNQISCGCSDIESCESK